MPAMNMSDYMQPKWWLETKRGVGMAMVALGVAVPMIAGWTGVTIDPATVGAMGAEIAKWFEVTWNVVAYALWLMGSFRPSAPITIAKPV
jgi:hypothetical protein